MKGMVGGMKTAIRYLMRCTIKAFGAGVILALSCVTVLSAQPPPPKGPPPNVGRRIQDVRRRLAQTPPADAEQKELAGFVTRYVEEATKALNAAHEFQAQRFAEAADACRRPIEHLQRIAGNLPAPPPPPGKEDALRQVYFRLKVADFFLTQIHPDPPKRLLELARSFYGRATTAQREGKSFISREYGAAADDLTKALENLAQASTRETR